MDEYNTDRSLRLLIGELLYKNQLLREAIASREQTDDLTTNAVMTVTGSACSRGVGNQLATVTDSAKLRDFESAKLHHPFRKIVDVTGQIAESFEL